MYPLLLLAPPEKRTVAAGPLLCLLALGLAACGSAEGESDGRRGEREAPVPAVEVVQARYGALPLRERLSGTVEAEGQVQVFPQSSGRLTSVTAQNGDFVQQGEVLARVNAQTSQAQLAQAQASLESAQASAQQAKANLEEIRAQFERTKKLAADSLVSQQELETQRAQLQSAKASYEQAQAQVQQARGTIAERSEAVGQTAVRAPISGRVGQRNAEVGMKVDGQTPLFTVGNLSEVQVTVPISQEMLGRIEEGQTARITSANLPGDSMATAEVSRISPFIEASTYSAEAEIDVNNESGRLTPGMFVKVDVAYGESQEAPLVPMSALYENPDTGARGVYVAPSLGEELQAPRQSTSEDGTQPLIGPVPTQFQPVEVVAEGSNVAGVRGIEPDSWVVVVGQHLLGGGGGDGPAEARVQATKWTRIMDLQSLQQQDLLRQVMDGQKQAAAAPDSSAWQADSAGTS